jgi:hypothetical protein
VEIRGWVVFKLAAFLEEKEVGTEALVRVVRKSTKANKKCKKINFFKLLNPPAHALTKAYSTIPILGKSSVVTLSF